MLCKVASGTYSTAVPKRLRGEGYILAKLSLGGEETRGVEGIRVRIAFLVVQDRPVIDPG